MNRPAQLGLYRIAEDLGSVLGSGIGIITGFGAAAWIPTYIRRQLTTNDPYSPFLGRETIYGLEQTIDEESPQEETIPQKIRSETAKRFSLGAHAAYLSSQNVSKYMWIGLCALDWISDGKPDRLGFLVVPIVLSLAYEGVRPVWNRTRFGSQHAMP